MPTRFLTPATAGTAFAAFAAFAALAVVACDSAGSERPVLRSDSVEVSRQTGAARDTVEAPADTVVFLGTSLTAGFGLADPDSAFPGVLGRRMRHAGHSVEVVNAGVSGDTSAGGLARLDWILQSGIDVLVVELGANDGLRGQSPEALEENLVQVVRRTRAAHPDARILLVGMEAPPNMGPRYTEDFRSVFPRVAEAERLTLLPFLLEGVAGVIELNQADGIHPTAEGHRRIADHVWPSLEAVLQARSFPVEP